MWAVSVFGVSRVVDYGAVPPTWGHADGGVTIGGRGLLNTVPRTLGVLPHLTQNPLPAAAGDFTVKSKTRAP